MKPGFRLVCGLIWLCLGLSTDVWAGPWLWINAGRDPNSLSLLAVDSLNVRADIAVAWKEAEWDTIYIQKKDSLLLLQATFGGTKFGSRFKIKNDVICAWSEYDSLAATRRIIKMIEDSTLTDTSIIYRITTYVLLQFNICRNLGWYTETATDTVLLPPAVPPQTKFAPSPPLPKKWLYQQGYAPKKHRPEPNLEIENFFSIGMVGGSLYASAGGRVNWHLGKKLPPGFAFSVKANTSRQASFSPSKQHYTGWQDTRNTQSYKAGLRLRYRVIIIYLYLGRDLSFDGWNKEMHHELEIMFQLPPGLRVETILDNYASANYLWGRGRAKKTLGYWWSGNWSLGAETYYEGDDAPLNPSFYAQRSGLVVEYLSNWKSAHWYSLIIHGGYGYYGEYFGAEFNLRLYTHNWNK